MSLANYISLFRIAALPLIVFFILKESVAWAIVILVFVFLSDFFDGHFASKRREITRIGSFLDPFADKILLYGLLIFFVWKKEISFLVPVLFFLRDLLLGITRWAASNEEVHLKEEKRYAQLGSYAQYALLLSLLLQGIFPILTAMMIFFTVLAIFFGYLSLPFYLALYFKGLKKNLRRGKEILPEQLVILTNKRSRGYRNLYRRRLLKLFARRRKAEIIFLPETEQMFMGVEKKISGFSSPSHPPPHSFNSPSLHSHSHHIIIAGGDGSFEGALNYLPLKKESLGFFPLGAGNY